jgi:hypothetical protein
MTSHIETLVQQLDGKADESYVARAELIWIGADAIPAVIAGVPSLGGFGQLTAIEVFEEVGDPRCGPALIGLLDSDNPTVREWAAMALASLKIDGAVSPAPRLPRLAGPGHPAGLDRAGRHPLGPGGTQRPHPRHTPPLRKAPLAGPRPLYRDHQRPHRRRQVILHCQFCRVEAGHTYASPRPASTERHPGSAWSRRPTLAPS